VGYLRLVGLFLTYFLFLSECQLSEVSLVIVRKLYSEVKYRSEEDGVSGFGAPYVI